MIVQGTKQEYEIKFSSAQNRWTCTCADFKYRRSKEKDGQCKHIFKFLQDSKAMNSPQDERYKPRKDFEPTADYVDNMLDSFQHLICGSFRRNAPFLKDLDVVVLCTKDEDITELRERVALVGWIESGGNRNITAKINNIQVDFKICTNLEVWGSTILHFTGSKIENIRLRKIASSKGMILSEYGLRDAKTHDVIASKTEEEIYKVLGETFKTPAQR